MDCLGNGVLTDGHITSERTPALRWGTASLFCRVETENSFPITWRVSGDRTTARDTHQLSWETSELLTDSLCDWAGKSLPAAVAGLDMLRWHWHQAPNSLPASSKDMGTAREGRIWRSHNRCPWFDWSFFNGLTLSSSPGSPGVALLHLCALDKSLPTSYIGSLL